MTWTDTRSLTETRKEGERCPANVLDVMEVGWSRVPDAMEEEPKSRLPSSPENARDAMVTVKSSALDAAGAAMHEVAPETQR